MCNKVSEIFYANFTAPNINRTPAGAMEQVSVALWMSAATDPGQLEYDVTKDSRWVSAIPLLEVQSSSIEPSMFPQRPRTLITFYQRIDWPTKAMQRSTTVFPDSVLSQSQSWNLESPLGSKEAGECVMMSRSWSTYETKFTTREFLI